MADTLTADLSLATPHRCVFKLDVSAAGGTVAVSRTDALAGMRAGPLRALFARTGLEQALNAGLVTLTVCVASDGPAENVGRIAKIRPLNDSPGGNDFFDAVVAAGVGDVHADIELRFHHSVGR